MYKVTDELKGLDIEINLTDNERGILSATVKQQGFELLQRLMEDQVRKFNFKLLNTNPANSDLVLANHTLAKAVAQFYTAFMDKIEQECQINAFSTRKPSVQEATEVPEFQ